jgi:hypothetical protein
MQFAEHNRTVENSFAGRADKKPVIPLPQERGELSAGYSISTAEWAVSLASGGRLFLRHLVLSGN